MSSATAKPPAAPAEGLLRSWWRRSTAQLRKRPIPSGIVLLGLLAAGFAAGYYAHLQLKARRNWNGAQKLIAEYEFREARIKLEECLQVWTHSPETHFVTARTCRRAGDIPAAEKYLRDAERLQWPPKDIEFEVVLIDLQRNGVTATNDQWAASYVKKRSPEEVLVLEAMCTGMFFNNQHGGAEHWLNHWVKHYADDWPPRLWRGHYFKEVGNTNLAQTDLERVLELRPEHAEAQRLLVEVYLKNGNPRRAMPLAEKCLQRQPDQAVMLAALAKCQRAMNQPDAARTTLARLLDKQPLHAGGLLTLAQIDADQDRLEAAVHWLRELDRGTHTDSEEVNTAAALRVSLLRRLGKDQEAIAAEARLEQLKDALNEYNNVMNELKTRPATVADRLRLGQLTLGVGLETQGLKLLEGVLRDAPQEKTKIQRLLLAFYEKREDAQSVSRANDMRRELGLPAP